MLAIGLAFLSPQGSELLEYCLNDKDISKKVNEDKTKRIVELFETGNSPKVVHTPNKIEDVIKEDKLGKMERVDRVTNAFKILMDPGGGTQKRTPGKGTKRLVEGSARKRKKSDREN